MMWVAKISLHISLHIYSLLISYTFAIVYHWLLIVEPEMRF